MLIGLPFWYNPYYACSTVGRHIVIPRLVHIAYFLDVRILVGCKGTGFVPSGTFRSGFGIRE